MAAASRQYSEGLAVVKRTGDAARPPKITETAEHRTIASYFRKIGLGDGALAIHVRNERGSSWERIIAKQMGVLAGIPDWMFIHRGNVGFIELKERGFNEKLSRGVGLTLHVQKQLAVHTQLRKAGSWVEICETLEDVLIALQIHRIPLRSESISTERIRRGMLSVLDGEVE